MKFKNLSIKAKTLVVPILFFLIINTGNAQTIPADSLYLGQKIPGDSAVVFAPGLVNLTGRNVPCISFSPDGKSAVFYVGFWPEAGNPYSMITEYKNGRWQAPALASFTTGRVTAEPIFSLDGNRIYLYATGVQNQVGTADLSYCEKTGSTWSNPKSMGSPPNLAQDQYHPCIVADTSVYFSTSNGEIARCQYQNGSYKPRVLLPFPVNYANISQTWGDPYVAPDESYLIFKSNRAGGYGLNDIYITYKKADGMWTNPKNLGAKINTRYDETAGDITPDGKYMTFSSNKTLYWISAGFIDRLRNSNFVPYVKTKLKNQTGKVGEAFNQVIPDSTFIDDDGNNTLSVYVTSRLPNGLNFDSDTRTFSGTPSEAGTFTVTVLAIDSEEASVSTTFTLKINNSSGISVESMERDVVIYPNPARDRIHLSFGNPDNQQATVIITDLSGKQIFSETIRTTSTVTIDLPQSPKGIYLLSLKLGGSVINKKIYLE